MTVIVLSFNNQQETGGTMLYFIPAWYHQDQWCENEQKWHVRRMHTEFDDTVKQIQLFHRSRSYPYQILLPGYTPNFRHFLHRQGIFHAPYWSCFDAVQEIRRKKAVPLSFYNMKWPPYTEFIYTMFAVVALHRGQKYAQIEFGEDGNPIQIDLYKKGGICRRNLYDDRGFLSSTILFQEDEKPFRQDYLMENGMWKLRHFLEDGHVEINPGCPEYLIMNGNAEEKRSFSRLVYDRLEQVIGEVFSSYVELTKVQDLFCLAMHDRHTGLMRKALKGKRTILSFFEDRYSYEEHMECLGLLESAGYVVMDSRESLKKIRQVMGGLIKKSKSIPPFDTRVDPGISQQLEVQKILVPVDSLEPEIFERMVRVLNAYLGKNDKAVVCLFTRQADYGRDRKLLDLVSGYLETPDSVKGQSGQRTGAFVSENAVDSPEPKAERFQVEQCVDELSVSRCMREQRVLLELREQPELYLQIMAISVGIPQIVRTRTQFVRPGRNGVVLGNINELSGVLAHYLESLKNWNDAMIASYRIGKKYTTDVLVKQWKEVIDSFGEDSNLTAGQ